MKTKYRLGYPYANPCPEKIRDTVIVLQPNKYSGYKEIIDRNNNIYILPELDPGPAILDSCRQGVIGQILEQDDKSKESIAQNGRINGMGTSMQLALVLSVFSDYKNLQFKDLPLILFSAAVEKPVGARPYLDAKITTYCDKEEIENDLQQKYQAAKMAHAIAFVLPKRDAKILSQKINQKIYNIKILSKISSHQVQEPYIVAVDDMSLPEIAKHIGISKLHYTSSQSSNFISVISKVMVLVLFILLFLWLRPLEDIMISDESFNFDNYATLYFANGRKISQFPKNAKAKLLSGNQKLYVAMDIKKGDVNAVIFFKEIYKPAKQGAIYSIEFKAAAFCGEATINNQVDTNGRLFFYFALQQNGKIYVTNKAHELLKNNFRICEETAKEDNFKEFNNSYLDITENSQPDFSSTGGKIRYGFVFFNGTKSEANIGNAGYIEKWSVVIKRN